MYDIFKMNNRQHYFLKEIDRLQYNKDEAYCEIINSKHRYKYFDELEKVIIYVFDERPKGRICEWCRNKNN